MRFSVVVFPGSNCDHDCEYVLGRVLNQEISVVWHKDRDLKNPDCVVLPGGFSFGDYLRTGAIARFSPVMESVRRFADAGGLVLGICNGFQILCEAGLLPGALVRNRSLRFVCAQTWLKVENRDTPFTRECPQRPLKVPVAHGEGSYYADPAMLAKLEQNRQVVVRYCDPSGRLSPESNPNGSLANIAGVCNERRNVFGLMPHPDRSAEEALGSADGLFFWRSLLASRRGGMKARVRSAVR